MFPIHDFWHGPGAAVVATVGAVESRDRERLSAAAGLVATIAVGVGALFAGPGDAPTSDQPQATVWWAAYGLFVAAFTVDADLVRWQPRWATGRRLLATELVAAAAAWLVSPGGGWTAVLFVVTAASAAYTLTERGALAVVAAQSGLVVLGTVLDGQSATQVGTAAVVYGSFQCFAVLVVGSERREAAARAELTAAHSELRAAAALLGASTRTAERLRISRDLHDVIGHQLTALALELEVASHHSSGDATTHVNRARSIASELLRDVRAAVGSLRASTTDLDVTLRELVRDLPGLTVSVSVDERAPLDEAQALTIVRCVQEVVTNTLRHAHANHLTISVVADDTGVCLDTMDDGRGAARLVPGHGLTGLRERVEQLGGEVVLETAPGRGFALSARVPVP